MIEQKQHRAKQGNSPFSNIVPIYGLLKSYKRDWISGDFVAGLIVAIMLIPQGMAYALLAGLPPQHGLYASILPVFVYGLLGTSRYLAVGPVAIVSLITVSGIGGLAEIGSAEFVQLAITLALMVGIIQFLMGLFRAGYLVNFLSHPVLSGFSSAAAIVIGFGQIKGLLGISIPRTEHFYEQVVEVMRHLQDTNWVSFGIGGFGILVLLYFKLRLSTDLKKYHLPSQVSTILPKCGPLIIVLLSSILVSALNLHTTQNVSIVGDIPKGLPSITIPNFNLDILRMLLPTALAISFVGYMESISVAKSLASKKNEKIVANQELFALGVANLGSAVTGGYPVTGGFSRSLVNYSAGSRSTVSSLITAFLIALSVLFLTPLFFFIPKPTLAAIIIVAVSGLFDWSTMVRVWQYNKRDAVALIATFISVLVLGVENGILIGAAVSLIMFIARTSEPHVAEIGKLPDVPFYRNVVRHKVQTWPDVSIVRIDASLYFANTQFLEETVADILIRKPDLKHLILVGTAINDVDFTALEALERILVALQDIDVTLHLAAFKGPVLDRLKQCNFLHHLGKENIHLTTHDAIVYLGH